MKRFLSACLLLLMTRCAEAAMLIKVEYLSNGEPVLETYYTARDSSSAAELLQLIKSPPEMASDEAGLVVPNASLALQATLTNATVLVKHTTRIHAQVSTNVLLLVRSNADEAHWYVPVGTYETLAEAVGLPMEEAQARLMVMFGVVAILIPVLVFILLLVRRNTASAIEG